MIEGRCCIVDARVVVHPEVRGEDNLRVEGEGDGTDGSIEAAAR